MADNNLEINLENLQWPRKIEKFQWLVLYSLKSYQSIELILKAYLSIYSNQESETKNSSLELGKFKNLPMNSLIKKFRNISSNKELIEKLDAIKDERNIIAHQALLLEDSSIKEVFGFEPLALNELVEIEKRASTAYLYLVKDLVEYDIRAQKEKEEI